MLFSNTMLYVNGRLECGSSSLTYYIFLILRLALEHIGPFWALMLRIDAELKYQHSVFLLNKKITLTFVRVKKTPQPMGRGVFFISTNYPGA